MKILLIADTHGKTKRVEEILNKVKGLDLIVHLGDFHIDALWIEDYSGIKTIGVRGNLDDEGEERVDLELECGKVMLTHGHNYHVKSDLTKLLLSAKLGGFCGVFFGHTHMAFEDTIDGIKVINPGSLSIPRDYSNGTYAVLRTSEEGIDCSIIEYSIDYLTNKKNADGKLRHLLNNSDRF